MANLNPEENKTGGTSSPENASSAPAQKPRRRTGLRLAGSLLGILLLVTAGLALWQLTGNNLPGLGGLPLMAHAPSPTNSPAPATPTSTPWPTPQRPPIDLENAKSLWFGGSLGKGRLIQVAFTPDGGRFIAMTMTGYYLYDVQNLSDPSFQFVTTRVEQAQWFEKPEVLSYAVSPADGRIAVGYASETVKIWNPESTLASPIEISPNAEDKLLDGEAYYSDSTSLACSQDGSLLAVGGSDNVVRLYHVPSRKLLGELTVDFSRSTYDEKWVTSVSFSPDGTLLASASTDGVIYLWRVSDGSLANVLQGHTAAVNGIVFSPDGSTLASGSWDGTVRLWRVTDGSESKVLRLGSGVSSVAFSPDGNTLAAGSFDGLARLWRMPDGEQIRTIAGHTDAVISVAFSPDGAILATGSLDSSVQFWNNADGSGIAALGGFLTDVLSLEFSPDDSILAAGLSNGDIQLLRLDFSSGSQGQFGHSGGSGSAWSQEGDLVESDSTNFFWPIEVSSAGVLHGYTGPAESISFSPDGEFLASASADSSVRVWRVDDGLPVADLRGHSRAVHDIDFSPDGSRLATAGEDGFIHLWNTEDWSLEGSLTSDGEPFTNVAFSPDGRILAAGSRSLESANNWGNVVIWNLSDKSVIKKFRATEVWDIYDLAFSPDSSKLIFSSFNAIVMYSIHDDAQVWTVAGEDVSAQPVGVDFLPGGEIVFCADEMAGNLCLFNAASGERIPVLYTKFSETCKAASHKGNLLAAGTPYGFIDLFYIY